MSVPTGPCAPSSTPRSTRSPTSCATPIPFRPLPTPEQKASTMTTIDQTALGRLEAEGRLLNCVLKGPTKKAGRIGFRGDLALKFQAKMADEARPPETSFEQVIAAAQEGEPHIAFLAGFLLS